MRSNVNYDQEAGLKKFVDGVDVNTLSLTIITRDWRGGIRAAIIRKSLHAQFSHSVSSINPQNSAPLERK